MRQARPGRKGRWRHVAKRFFLLLRLLRARPLAQRCLLFVVLVAPLLLSLYAIFARRRPVQHIKITAPEAGNAFAETLMRGASLEDHLTRAPHREARIAYFVQVGGDAVSLLPRLFRAIHHPDNVYVVHIDAKVPVKDREEVLAFVAGNSALHRNVHFLPSEMVTYKGVSMVFNTLAGMTLALRVDSGWDYFINLSGADYPLMSPLNQRRLLARPGVALGRLNFLTLFPQSEWRPFSFRIRFMHWDPAVTGLQYAGARLRVFRGIKEYPLEKYRHFTFTKAEAWMILSRPFVKFVLRSTFAKKMLLNHIHVRSAPEHYFSDVLYNHAIWRKTLVPDAFRKVVWVHKRRRSGQHPYVLDRGENIYSFWEYLRETRSLFTRKFSVPNSQLLERIDQRLSGIVLNPTDGEITMSKEARMGHQAFYSRMCAHFDVLTQKTLLAQNVSWPADAYPPPQFAVQPG